MNKKETRHQLIRSLVSETKVRTQHELRELLEKKWRFSDASNIISRYERT